MAKDYGPHGGSSRSNDRSHDRGGDRHRSRSTPTRSRIQSDRQADFKANPKNYRTRDRGGNLPNRTGILGNTIHNISNFYRDNIYDRRPHDLKARRNFLMKNNLMKLDPVLDQDEYGDPRYSDSDWLTSREGLEHLQGLGYTGGYSNVNDPNHPNYDSSGGGQPYIWPYPTASAPIEEEEIVVADSGLGSGHFRVPEQYRLAEGGRIPAAFGGIMDTSTGRRGYFGGSIGRAISKPFKKAAKAVKKLASSPIGKLAMMYAAGTYLGGTQALSGKFGGAGTFAERLRDPKLLANLIKTDQWGTAIDPKVDKGFRKALQNKKLIDRIPGGALTAIGLPSVIAGGLTAQQPVEELDDVQGQWDADKAAFDAYLASLDDEDSYRVPDEYILSAEGGRIGKQEGGLMDLGGMEKDYRNDGGFVPIGGQEKADDVPARLSRNEFVFTADAVRSAGGGDIDKGAEVMENVMKNLEAGGKVSEESQGKGGAQEMFEVSERLSEVM